MKNKKKPKLPTVIINGRIANVTRLTRFSSDPVKTIGSKRLFLPVFNFQSNIKKKKSCLFYDSKRVPRCFIIIVQ